LQPACRCQTRFERQGLAPLSTLQPINCCFAPSTHPCKRSTFLRQPPDNYFSKISSDTVLNFFSILCFCRGILHSVLSLLSSNQAQVKFWFPIESAFHHVSFTLNNSCMGVQGVEDDRPILEGNLARHCSADRAGAADQMLKWSRKQVEMRLRLGRLFGWGFIVMLWYCI